jgi:MFS transporter, PAT family, beta-lactamase induction signal transducer AmpG
VRVRLGATVAFLAMAALLLAVTAPVLFAKEKPRPAPREGAEADPAAHFLRRAGAWQMIALIFVYKLGDAFATAMIKPFVRDRGFSLEDQALLLGTYGSVAGMLGALIGGALVGPLGRRRALVVFGALQIFTMGAYAAAAAGLGGRDLIYVATTLEHFVSGMATAALFTVMMDACRPERAATDYTVQASAFVVAAGAAQMLSGFFAQPLGYLAHFCASTALAAASVPAALWLYAAPPARASSEPPAARTSGIDAAVDPR